METPKLSNVTVVDAEPGSFEPIEFSENPRTVEIITYHQGKATSVKVGDAATQD